MAATYGRTLTPWQHVVSDVTGEVLPDGRMAYPVVVLLVPRRGGKTDLTLPTAVQRVSIAPGSRAWYTAQTGGDASDIMREEWIPRIVDEECSLHALAKAGLSNGREGLWLPGRRSVRMFAPTRRALHSKDADFVCVDEVWSFTLEEGQVLDAGIRPTMLTRPRRQVFYISAGGTDDSTWLLALREMGRRIVEEGRSREAGVAYFEWSADADTDDLNDPATWAGTHPAVGHTVDLDALRADRASLGTPVFNRSYLNVFQSSDRPRILPELGWSALRDDTAAPAGPLVIAFDVAEDLSHGSVVAVGRSPAGELVAELIDYRPGIDWMPDRLIELRRRHGGTLAAAGDGPPSGVVADLVDAGERPRLLTATDRITADGELLSVVLGARRHPLRIRPAAVLDRAAGGVDKRTIGDGFIFVRAKSSGDVSPLVALSVGRHVAEHVVMRKPVVSSGR